ncbi:MAG TPA: tetratricopeptide repeat protein [Accumulibacter sp.]|uniref:tetratricopeptide repeat protein n=1 Tax=Accumulibacter sp. TaxID=2053492 RepID=UPI0025FA5190|nr:tetratricopeptide repeat protein [Accumulibacter sp.]MCM8599564.1 tetratricopeptide repeat protein [Accumulibacter sp.]MCM8663495.1 tetratricopeptide repeat protein [Accumulibacter sp.]HNC50987.1 tetratricopeptide repeat protein [Accumulibacter sp.]
MATYDLEEQEQIAEIKAWWKQYGNLVAAIVTAVAVGFAAWQGWNWYQRSQAAQAGQVYAALQKAVAEKDPQRIKAASGELFEKYSRTAYAPLAALLAARVLNDTGDAKTAKLQLVWVVENGKDELRDLARLRLASLLLDEKAYDEALKQLDVAAGSAFTARFQDMRGDILSAQDKTGEARAAYQAVLAKLDEADAAGKGGDTLQDTRAHAAYRESVLQKLDALAEPHS